MEIHDEQRVKLRQAGSTASQALKNYLNEPSPQALENVCTHIRTKSSEAMRQAAHEAMRQAAHDTGRQSRMRQCKTHKHMQGYYVSHEGMRQAAHVYDRALFSHDGLRQAAHICTLRLAAHIHVCTLVECRHAVSINNKIARNSIFC